MQPVSYQLKQFKEEITIIYGQLQTIIADTWITLHGLNLAPESRQSPINTQKKNLSHEESFQQPPKYGSYNSET
jgi:hypothetical protein